MSDSHKLREADIRPDHLMAEQKLRYQADVRRLLTRRHEFVFVTCPACLSDEYRPKFTKDEIQYVTCERCGTLFTNPRPTPEVLEYFYAHSENYEYWNTHIFPASEHTRRQHIFGPRAERAIAICSQYKAGFGTLMDVGAGFGTFCEEVRRLGLFSRIIAVEPTPDLAETCRNRGLEVIARPIEQVDFPASSVDVITTFEVLEHLFSPREFLLKCRELLTPSGVLILTCPNGHGFDVQVLGTLSNTIDIEHLNYFHPASIARMIDECGFSVLEVSTPGKLDAELVRKQVLAGTIDLSSQVFLQQILIDEWEQVGTAFQDFLAHNNLSSHMWVVAQKPG